jgi:hypothetical protein
MLIDTPQVDTIARGGAMERRNEYADYHLGTQLALLRFLREDQDAFDALNIIFPAWKALNEITVSHYSGMTLCVEQINGLLSAVKALLPSKDQIERKLTSYEVVGVQQALNALETALSIQFSQVNTYRVTPKGTHDVKILIEASYETFGRYWYGMSELARGDWQSGARCLAFELPTACGFHVVRAMEAVIVDFLNRTDKTPSRRDLYHYVQLMRELGTSEEATDLVEQIRKHHRNPLMHPEDVLDVPTALSLYDLCRAAIVSIVAEMERRDLVSIEDQGNLLQGMNAASSRFLEAAG